MRKWIVAAICMCFFSEAGADIIRFRIIVDTDGAADDLRAICLLLANPEIDILAVVSSEGALMSADATLKVKSLLHSFHRENIPVGTGRDLNIAPPVWRRQSELIEWGKADKILPPQKTARDLIVETLEKEAGADDKVIYLCLGALTNLSDVVTTYPNLCERIGKVLWYGHSKLRAGSNYENDKESAEKMFQRGIEMDVISGMERSFVINEQYMNRLVAVNNPYADRIVKTHRGKALVSVVASGHMRAWDDLLVVYLFAPELYAILLRDSTVTVYSLRDEEAVERSMEIIVEMLKGRVTH
ncbi:Pyrimidine-specific ribonucleoside hydrolase RihA [termite gut metagenome]|uniref:Pyrimidine-specific ribonucleoside hydrolase RihA n=1 Tax=termite gut metagenome TaxID=433724 RepID=A0A5J4RLJ5_9ZZZZ